MTKACGLLLLAGLVSVACSAAPDDGASGTADEISKSTDKTQPGSFGSKPGAAGSCTARGKETCSGGVDEDCDGLVDCQDPDCSGVGSCPVCGAVDKPEAAPLALPDGNDGEGVPYESKLKFTGFAAGQTLRSASDFVKVCVTMEHSWLRDLEIKLISPNKKEVILTDFRGHNGGAIHLGQPNTRDDDSKPVPGAGAEYCWAADATRPAMLDTPEAKSTDEGLSSLLDSATLPAGSYQPVGSIDAFSGSTLDGEWTMRVTDRWSGDNGFIFGWSISFNPALVADCSAPLVEPNVK